MIDRGWPAWPTPSKRVHALVVALAVGTLSQALVGQQPVSPDTRAIVATRHEPLPAQPSAYWLSPAASSSVSPAMRDFARAVDMIEQGGDIAGAAPLLAVPGLEASTLGTHVRYYRGVVAQRQFRLDEALALFTPLAASAPRSFVVDEAQVRLAEVHELRGQFAAAAEAYGRAVSLGSAEPDRLLHRWAVALERAGDAAASVKAHRRVYYYPVWIG